MQTKVWLHIRKSCTTNRTQVKTYHLLIKKKIIILKWTYPSEMIHTEMDKNEISRLSVRVRTV